MIPGRREHPVVRFSVRVYQALLAAYPIEFKQEYGSQMTQLFRDCCLQALRQVGMKGMIRLWAITLLDLIQSVIAERSQKETIMTRSNFIRLSGWSLILGAVTLFLFILSAYLDNNVYDPLRRLVPFTEFGTQLGVWATPILLGTGLLGLRTRYGDEVGGFGKNILLLGAIAGPVINITGIAFVEIVDWAWILSFTGNAVLLACLSIFGISALSAKPLPRWNSLPIIVGIWYPVLLIFYFAFEAFGVSQDLISNLANIVLPLESVLLAILGYMLQADAPGEILATG